MFIADSDVLVPATPMKASTIPEPSGTGPSANNPATNPRAWSICAGALICDAVASRVGRPMMVRETDILDGAALALVAQR